MKSKSKHLFAELKRFSESKIKSDSNRIDEIGFVKKCYTCTICLNEFVKQGDFKKHIKIEHKSREEEKGEVKESVQQGEVSE